MRYVIVATSSDSENRWIEDFPSEARAREMLPRRGYRIVSIAPATAEDVERFEREGATQRAAAVDPAQAEHIILTTAFTVAGREIERELEIVTAECGYGMNIFRDMMAGFRDFVGGRSGTVQNVLRDARRTALSELKHEAFIVGADAVIGVDLAYQQLSDGKMLLLVASGTAVKLAPRPSSVSQSQTQ